MQCFQHREINPLNPDIIHDLGKYEGLPIWAPSLHDQSKDGTWEIFGSVGEEGYAAIYTPVTEDDARAWPKFMKVGQWIVFEEFDSGNLTAQILDEEPKFVVNDYGDES